MQFQTNVILTQDDADWLDDQTLAFRKNNRKPLSRSALLRALLQAARTIKLDVSRCRSAEQIAHDLAYLLRRATREVQDEATNRCQARTARRAAEADGVLPCPAVSTKAPQSPA